MLGKNRTNLISNLTTNWDLHGDKLAVQPGMKHLPELAKLPNLARQPLKVHHLMLRRLIHRVAHALELSCLC